MNNISQAVSASSPESAPKPAYVKSKAVESKTVGNKFSYDTADILPLIDRFIDEPRPLRVAVIGGGLTGITAGVLLPQKVPGIQLTIYEKNADFVSTLVMKPNTTLMNTLC